LRMCLAKALAAVPVLDIFQDTYLQP